MTSNATYITNNILEVFTSPAILGLPFCITLIHKENICFEYIFKR